MIVKKEAGFAVRKDVEVVVNSSNGLLVLDSAGAGVIRDVSREMTADERVEFEKLIGKLPTKVAELIIEKQKLGGWKEKYANLSALRLLIANTHVFHLGSAILDEDWSGIKADDSKNEDGSTKDNNNLENKKVIHAITMSYEIDTKERIKGTTLSVQTAIESALRLVLEIDAKSVAIPIACAREGYGIKPKESYKATLKALEIIKDKDIEVILCFDNEDTEKFREELILQETKGVSN